MASLIEKKENNIVQLTIDVTPEAFNEALQRSFKKNTNKFSVPGFRKGKAPLNVVTKYYGEGVLYEDAIDFAATPAYVEAIAEHGLEPVSRPDMDVLEIGRDVGLKFTVEVTIKPEVALGPYKGVEAVMPEFNVTAEDVERDLQQVRERNSRLVPIEDRAIAEGDTVNIDYEGSLDGVPFEGGQGSSYDLKIGSNTFIPGFEEQLIGKNAGEECDLDITFPEDYHSEELKGRAVVFNVKINAVKVREMPELDDEFAKDVSEFDTLAEYKDSLRAKLVENAEKRAEGTFEDNAVQAVVGKAEVDIPHVMIHQEMDRMVDEQRQQMRYQGIELEQYLGYIGQNIETFTSQLHEPAEARIKTSLVLEAIGKIENVEASEEEIDAEIERMAVLYGMKAEDLKSRFASDDNNFMKENVIRQKTVTLIKENAVKIAPPVVSEMDAIEAKAVSDLSEAVSDLPAADSDQ